MSRSESPRGADQAPLLNLTLERFDYARVGDHVAVMQVLARVHGDHGAPAAAELTIYAGPAAPLRFPARTCRAERRLVAGGGTQTLWRALFTVPLSAVERTGVLFELGMGASLAETVILPVPATRLPGPAALQLIPADVLSRTGAGQLRQAVAVATAVAVTATSTPALAAATAATPLLHAGGTQARISDQVRIAQDHLSQQNLTVGAPTSSTSAAPAASGTAQAATDSAPAATGSTPSTTGSAPAAGAASASTGATTKPAAATPTSAAQTTGASAAHSATRLAKHVAQGPAKHATQTPAKAKAAAHHLHSAAHRGHGAPRTEGLAPGPNRLAHPNTSSAPVAPAHTDTGATGATGTSPTGQPSASSTVGAPTAVPVGNSGGVAIGNTVTAGQLPATTQAGTTPTPAPTPAPTLSPTPPTTTGTPAAQPGSTPPRVHGSHPEPSSRSHAHTGSHHSGGAAILSGLTHEPPDKLAGSGTTPTGAAGLSANPPGFAGPQSWSGTVTEDPALQGALGNLSNLLANGNTPPGFLIPIYMEAGRRYNVPWEVLAAINAVESDYGRNLNTSSAGAIGWMQFEPATWREWGLAVDGHSVPNPYDPRDAIFSAARYLAAAGAAKDIWGAIYAYNHASWYVDMVMTRARTIAANVQPARKTIRRGVVSVFFTTDQHTHPTVRFRGGVLSHYVRLVASANMVSAANFPYVWGGGHEQPARFAPFDCSGSVSYVIQQAGYKVPTTTSGSISSWGFPRGPGRVTIFYNPTHTFMRIGNRYFGTSGFARPSGGGAGWFSTNRLPASYLAQFSEVHVPQLGANSFSRHRRLRLRRPSQHRHGLTALSSTRPVVLSALSPAPPFPTPRTFPSRTRASSVSKRVFERLSGPGAE